MILLCGFMGVGFLLMNTALISGIRETFYRETSSNTYNGALFPLAYLLVEIPWLALFCFEVCSVDFDRPTVFYYATLLKKRCCSLLTVSMCRSFQ